MTPSQQGENPAVQSGIVWQPTRDYIDGSNVARLMKKHGISSYAELLRRSTEDLEWFWAAVAEDLGISWYQPYSQVVDLSQGAPWAKWFRGGLMNIANDCVDKHATGPRQGHPALIWEGEEGAVRSLSYAELQAEANRLANGLRALGIGKGDRVGLYLPMVPETVAAIVAIAKLGAIFTPIFSGYGAQAVAARLNDSEAKLLITADGFFRRSQPVPMKEAADEAAALSPSVQHVIVVRRAGRQVPWTEGRDLWWDDVVANQPATFETLRLDPEDPVMVIYTSGTTGKPKGAVHVHAGFPLKSAQDISQHFDLKQDEVLFWFTDIGWMMGPWMIFGTLM